MKIENFLGPRHADAHDTELEANERAYPYSGARAEAAFELYSRPEGATDDEVHRILGVPYSSVQPTRHQLMKLGIVVKSDDRRPTRFGRPAIVWRAA